MTYTASLLTAAKKIETVLYDLPDSLGAGDVRLQLATASLCGTDLHYYNDFSNAGFLLNNSLTLGHEACGYVLDSGASHLSVGQLVALNPIIECGACARCQAGQENHCTNKRFPGSATTVPHIDGFFREVFDFPHTSCHPVPSGVIPSHLTFVEPLACAMHSVTQSGVSEGDRLLVTGCGPMGLLTVLAAVAVGAEVDVTDVRTEAIALAQSIGAGEGYLAGDSTPDNDAYTAVIEASGAPQAFNGALEAVARRGTLVILSSIQPSATPINLHRIMLKELCVLGSFQFNREFKEAIALVASGRIDLDKLISARYPVSQVGDALAFMAAGKAAGKILIEPEG